MPLRAFLSDTSGAVTLDWVVLSAALIGTGLAVMSTVSAGIENVGDDVDTRLRGQIIRAAFEGDACRGGIDALQAREDTRVAQAGGNADRIDVLNWSQLAHAGVDDAILLEDYDRLSNDLAGTQDWTRDSTILGALECELVLRGLR